MTSLVATWTVQAIRRSTVPLHHGHVRANRALVAGLFTARHYRATTPREKKKPSSAVLSATGKFQQISKNAQHPKPAQKHVPSAVHQQKSRSDHAVEDVKHKSPLPQVPATRAAAEDQTKTEAPAQEAAASVARAQQSAAAIPYARVDYIKSLTNITKPVCLYQAPPQRRYAVVCYSSMLFFVAVAKFNYNSIIAFAGTNPWALVYAGIICSMYGAIAMYCGMAPQKMVRSIYAIPTQHVGIRSGPMLEVTFKPILPFQKPTPIRFPAVDLARDAEVVAKVEERLAAEANERLRFRWGQGFFRAIRGVLFDVVNMFTRKNFVYVSLPRAGQCKVDLPGAVNLGRGHALEQLIRMDQSKRKMFRKMLT